MTRVQGLQGLTIAQTNRPLSVLVIDDEALIRWALAETLSEAGHTVAEAPNGAGGLRAVMTATKAFDLIFLDFRLPDSNDFSLLAAIRSRAPQSAVVLMTASAMPGMVDEAHRQGVHRLLHKPFDMLEVRSIVRAAA